MSDENISRDDSPRLTATSDLKLRRQALWRASRITLIYTLAGIAWILLSDLFFGSFAEASDLVAIGIIKGTAYVLASSLLILGLVYSGFYKVIKAHRSIQNVNRQLKAERNLAHSYFDNARMITVILDKDLTVSQINREGLRLLGMNKRDVLGQDWVASFVPPEEQAAIRQGLAEALSSGDLNDLANHDNTILTASGDVRHIAWQNALILDDHDDISRILSTGLDRTGFIQAQSALVESERSKSVFIDNLPGIAFRCRNDKNWTMEFISDGCIELTGYQPEDIILNRIVSYNDLIAAKFRDQVWQDWQLAVDRKARFRGEYQLVHRDKTARWVMETGQPIFGEDGQVQALEGIVIDIDDAKKRNDQILYMNDHDDLTGLFNRRYYEKAKANLDTPDHLPLSIVLADINGTRLVNDAFGHAAGDRLIRSAGSIIRSCLPKDTLLARIGGDEFAVLLPNSSQETIELLISCIHQACRSSNLASDTGPGELSLSFGYATRQDMDSRLDDVEKEAEDIMYRHKLLNQESYHNAIISSVMATMLARSQETEEHAMRLAVMCRQIGETLKLPQKSMDELQLLAMLHDIGKIGVDDSILNKPGKLDDQEWAVMKTHPEIGYRIAMSTSSLASVAPYILHHHERWDGRGYPNGITCEQIPLLSRILAVTDAYDAMTHCRAYRQAMSHELAIEEIRQNAGSQFDPGIVDVFLNLDLSDLMV